MDRICIQVGNRGGGIKLILNIQTITHNEQFQYEKYPSIPMRKYETIKRIDLMDRQRESSLSRQKHFQSRLQSQSQSISRSSHKNTINSNTDFMECLTDRSKTDKIQQFNPNPLLLPLNDGMPQGPSNTVKSNIRTFIRFKPFNKQELMGDEGCSTDENCIDIIDDRKIIVDQNLCYSFDRVFEPEASQRMVYDVAAREIVKSFVNGYNGTIFAYGQTGSGKTYTMFGGDESTSSGIIPLSIQSLFAQIQTQKQQGIRKISLSCSMYQIYKQLIIDLMCQPSSQKQKQIKIKQTANGSVQIQNLTVKEVTSKEELFQWISTGSELRKTRGTEVNERSSRSHLVVSLYLNVKVSQVQSKVSKLNLVDLAGSEKVSKTKVSGQGLQEAIKINLSLSCLGNAIYALSKGQQHVPFRDSKLTRVLQESLSGNSITRVIVTCSILPSCKQETISSLKFANRIKTIKTSSSQNIKKMNEQGVNKFMYQTLKASFQNCQEKLEKIKNFVDGHGTKMSKQEILETIRSIIYTDERFENQFLTMQSIPFETFRSPNKDQSSNFFDHGSQSLTLAKQDSKTVQVDEHIKNLECILMKQEKIIERQAAQLEKLRKQHEQRPGKTEQEQKKISQKLKILKSNPNSFNLAPKFKKISSQSRQPKPFQQNQIPTFRTKYQDSNKKINQQNNTKPQSPMVTESLNQLSQKFAECLKQKSSFESMEKEIMMKQIKALGFQVSYWRKLVEEGLRTGKVGEIGDVIGEVSEKLAKQGVGEEEILKKRLQQKENYIEQLQKMVKTKIESASNSKNISLKQSIDLGHTISQPRRKIQLYTSPNSSRMMTRVNSARQLTKV